MKRIFIGTKAEKTPDIPACVYDKLMMKYSGLCHELDRLKAMNDKLDDENRSLRAQIREAQMYLQSIKEGER